MRKFLKPGTINGQPMIIPLPGKDRNVSSSGEELTITPYIERRICSKELVEVLCLQNKKKRRHKK